VFDLATGNKHELMRVPGGVNFDIFPDGSGFAVVIGDPPMNRIRIIRSSGKTETEFAVEGWSAIQHLWSSPDSKGLYLTSRRGVAPTLLYVDLRGKARVIWQGSDWDASAVPSPDGRRLAIRVQTTTSDAWLLENF
jgi:Tol biopolymer transport system component